MRTLAIETATEACSVALVDMAAPPKAKLLGHDHRVLGRGHAEELLPMIAALPDKGRADRIVVSLGPGSFTGIRVGLAAARALGFAWQAEVLGYQTLDAISQACLHIPGTEMRPFESGGPEPRIVCMNGGHGEWFVQAFDPALEPIEPVRSMSPHDAVARFKQQQVVGSRAEEFVELRGYGDALFHLPSASDSVWLFESHLTSDLAPIYGRGPDATPQKQGAG